MTVGRKTTVSSLLDELAGVLNRVKPTPSGGSPAAQERKSFSREESIRTLDTHAHVLLQSAADNLAALDRLVEDGDLAIAPWVAARASLEGSAHVVWLLDRTVDVTERVGRSLALRYESLRAQEVLASSDKDTRLGEQIRDRIEEVEKVATGLGFRKLRDPRGKRNGIAVRKPSKTELVAGILGNANLYRILSGVAHSDPNVLSELSFVPVGTPGPHGVMKVPAPATGVLKLLVARVTAAFSRGAWEAILRHGADAAEAAVILEKRFDELCLRDDGRTRFWRVTVRKGSRLPREPGGGR